MKFRVWFNPTYEKRSSEAEDGEEFEADDAQAAALGFAENRYSYMGHLDPGNVLVRNLETNEITEWDIAARILFRASQRQSVAEDEK